MMQPFLSICIPSYNRPEEILRLLESIDITDKEKVEIVVCEDKAPKREQVREKVQYFQSNSEYAVVYHENEQNLGYDKNIRECINAASGKWIIYMGDDDLFLPGVMDEYIRFLESNPQLGYVLRSYQVNHADGSIEKFRYFDNTRFFQAGFDAYVTLFRKSVFISGFAFRREYAIDTLTDRFDGSLLYQLYVQAEICMNHASAYYATPITQSIDGGIPYFGNSESERHLYTPGTITLDNSINFMKNFFVITKYMDEKYSIHSTEYVRMDISKYSYPILSIQRKKGRKVFREYNRQLREIGLDVSKYYSIYYIALYLLGERTCDRLIRMLKKVLGRTPRL